MTHYEVLEVSEKASLPVIEAAWKVLMRRYHAEGSEPDEEQARLVNNAHDVLENQELRHKYDLHLNQERAAEARQQQAATNAFTGTPAGYPNAYPPDILQMMAMRMGSSVLNNMMDQVPELRFMLNLAMKARSNA